MIAKIRAAVRRLNASRLGVRGAIPLGSTVSTRRAGVEIGRSFFASGPVWIESVVRYEGKDYSPKIRIGENVRASPRLHVSAVSEITIGDWVLFGENVFVADHQHGSTRGQAQTSPFEPPALRELSDIGAVYIGDRCHLGNNVVVLPGTRIGDGAIIGANSVVRGEIPAGTIAVGSPARVVKRWDERSSTWSASAE